MWVCEQEVNTKIRIYSRLQCHVHGNGLACVGRWGVALGRWVWLCGQVGVAMWVSGCGYVVDGCGFVGVCVGAI